AGSARFFPAPESHSSPSSLESWCIREGSDQAVRFLHVAQSECGHGTQRGLRSFHPRRSPEQQRVWPSPQQCRTASDRLDEESDYWMFEQKQAGALKYPEQRTATSY